MKVIYFSLSLALLAILFYVGFVFGYYQGAGQALLHEKIMKANSEISVLNSIRERKLDSAVNMVEMNLKAEMGGISDINLSFQEPGSIFERYTKYRNMLSYEKQPDIDRLSRKYKELTARQR